METLSSDPAIPEDQSIDPPVDLNILSQEALEILGTMLPLLSFEVKFTSTIDHGSVRIHVECKDAGRLIGRKGATINEIQFLLNRILQRRHRTVPRIFLDVNAPLVQESPEGKKLSDEMAARVRSVADQVHRWGKPAELGTFKGVECQHIQEIFAEDRELEVVTLEPNVDPSKPQRLELRVRQKPG